MKSFWQFWQACTEFVECVLVSLFILKVYHISYEITQIYRENRKQRNNQTNWYILRLHAGEQVILSDGKGNEELLEITEISKEIKYKMVKNWKP